jgi:hypothetical protein
MGSKPATVTAKKPKRVTLKAPKPPKPTVTLEIQPLVDVPLNKHNLEQMVRWWKRRLNQWGGYVPIKNHKVAANYTQKRITVTYDMPTILPIAEDYRINNAMIASPDDDGNAPMFDSKGKLSVEKVKGGVDTLIAGRLLKTVPEGPSLWYWEANQRNGCVRQFTKKYTERLGPPYPANKCFSGTSRSGNDRRLYKATPNKNGVNTWQPDLSNYTWRKDFNYTPVRTTS